jgi:hypothetical protein
LLANGVQVWTMLENATVSIHDMRACLGSLLMLWSDIEGELREHVARYCGTVHRPAYGVGACLRSWRHSIPGKNDIGQFRGNLADCLILELQCHIKLRNRLCHGLTGYSSGTERSAQLSWRLNGEEGHITYKELQDSFGWLAGIPRAFSVLSRPSVVGKFDRCVDTAENRQWWQTEFALAPSG